MPGMRGSSGFLAGAAFVSLVACTPARQESERITLRAADGRVVHGVLYPAERPRGTILLFHQANASSGEYATIAPRLAAAGYSALAIDQRSGGTLFGPNRTVAALDRSTSFSAAEPDVDAAFGWAKARRAPILVWGSSYSTALALRLAARHPGEVAAVLLFSPGEYLERPDTVRIAASRITAPLFVAAASDPQEVAAARSVLAAAPARVKVAYLPATGGVHGSSTLIEARNPGGTAPAWKAVEGFLVRTR